MNRNAINRPPALEQTTLDVRGLPPPEPMQHVMAALARLPTRRTLVVQIHREPVFLFDLIEPQGWRHSARELAPARWEVCIWRAVDEA